MSQSNYCYRRILINKYLDSFKELVKLYGKNVNTIKRFKQMYSGLLAYGYGRKPGDYVIQDVAEFMWVLDFLGIRNTDNIKWTITIERLREFESIAFYINENNDKKLLESIVNKDKQLKFRGKSIELQDKTRDSILYYLEDLTKEIDNSKKWKECTQSKDIGVDFQERFPFLDYITTALNSRNINGDEVRRNLYKIINTFSSGDYTLAYNRTKICKVACGGVYEDQKVETVSDLQELFRINDIPNKVWMFLDMCSNYMNIEHCIIIKNIKNGQVDLELQRILCNCIKAFKGTVIQQSNENIYLQYVKDSVQNGYKVQAEAVINILIMQNSGDAYNKKFFERLLKYLRTFANKLDSGSKDRLIGFYDLALMLVIQQCIQNDLIFLFKASGNGRSLGGGILQMFREQQIVKYVQAFNLMMNPDKLNLSRDGDSEYIKIMEMLYNGDRVSQNKKSKILICDKKLAEQIKSNPKLIDKLDKNSGKLKSFMDKTDNFVICFHALLLNSLMFNYFTELYDWEGI